MDGRYVQENLYNTFQLVATDYKKRTGRTLDEGYMNVLRRIMVSAYNQNPKPSDISHEEHIVTLNRTCLRAFIKYISDFETSKFNGGSGNAGQNTPRPPMTQNQMSQGQPDYYPQQIPAQTKASSGATGAAIGGNIGSRPGYDLSNVPTNNHMNFPMPVDSLGPSQMTTATNAVDLSDNSFGGLSVMSGSMNGPDQPAMLQSAKDVDVNKRYEEMMSLRKLDPISNDLVVPSNPKNLPNIPNSVQNQREFSQRELAPPQRDFSGQRQYFGDHNRSNDSENSHMNMYHNRSNDSENSHMNMYLNQQVEQFKDPYRQNSMKLIQSGVNQGMNQGMNDHSINSNSMNSHMNSIMTNLDENRERRDFNNNRDQRSEYNRDPISINLPEIKDYTGTIREALMNIQRTEEMLIRLPETLREKVRDMSEQLQANLEKTTAAHSRNIQEMSSMIFAKESKVIEGKIREMILNLIDQEKEQISNAKYFQEKISPTDHSFTLNRPYRNVHKLNIKACILPVQEVLMNQPYINLVINNIPLRLISYRMVKSYIYFESDCICHFSSPVNIFESIDEPFNAHIELKNGDKIDINSFDFTMELWMGEHF